MKQLKHLILIVFLLLTYQAFADPLEDAKGVVKGKIIDSKTKQPLEYVSIAVYREANGELVTGSITHTNGEFKITDVGSGEFYVEVSFMGYQTQRIDQIKLSNGSLTANIGILELLENSENLEEVEVVAERASIDYKIDKKIVNVSKQYTAVSGSAVDVLENVPSVTVDIEGNVSLRGSTDFMVLINGIPSILEPSEALQQIPSSSIENIEIITNPSAKYNPEGTGGIINIITKKNVLQGVNGVVNATGGTNGYGGDFLFNYKKDKVGFYIAGDYNTRLFKGGTELERESYGDEETSYVSNIGTSDHDMTRTNFRFGFDYQPNDKNSLNIDLNAGKRSFSSVSSLDYSQWTTSDLTPYSYLNKESSDRNRETYSASMTYLHKFEEKGHELKVMASNRYKEGSDISENQLYDENGSKTEGRKNLEEGPGNQFQANVDYTKPIGKEGKLEAGYQIALNSDIDETQYLYDETGNEIYEEDTQFTNKTSYTKNIHSIYSTFSNSYGKFGYQLGLRGEYTYREVDVENTASSSNVGSNSVIDRMDWFPTVHLSYKLPEQQELMTSYTRRIQRPRGFYLEPFVTWVDAYNVRQGNADLLPEYIDAYEIAYLKKWDKAFINFEGYYRVTHNKTEWIRSVYEENSDIIKRMPENVGEDYSLGLDATISFDIFSWWRADWSTSMYNYQMKGQYNSQDFDTSDFMWNTRINSTVKLNKTTQLQLFSRYNSKRVTAQGYNKPDYSTDIAFRKEFFDRKLTGVFQVRDIFNQNRRASVSESVDFYEYEYRSMNGPFFSLTLTYRFNNYRPDRSKQKGSNSSLGSEEDF